MIVLGKVQERDEPAIPYFVKEVGEGSEVFNASSPGRSLDGFIQPGDRPGWGGGAHRDPERVFCGLGAPAVRLLSTAATWVSVVL